MKPSVTVLMPVRNGLDFLDAAIGSVLAQSFADFEFIVVDDGSADATAARLRHWAGADDRLRVLTRPPEGIAAALNGGLSQAAAPLIVRMDADDVARPDRLATLAAAARRHPEAAVIGSAYTIIGPDGASLRDIVLPTEPAEIRAMLPRRNPIAHPTVLLRRGVGAYRTAFPGCEDYDLWLRIAERHALRNLPEPLLLYRRHHGQHSARDLRARLVAEIAANWSAGCRRGGSRDFGDDDAVATRAVLARAGLDRASLRRLLGARALDVARGTLGERDGVRAREALRVAFRDGPRADPAHALRCLALSARLLSQTSTASSAKLASQCSPM